MTPKYTVLRSSWHIEQRFQLWR